MLESLVILIIVVDVRDILCWLPSGLSLGVSLPPDQQVLPPILHLEVQYVPNAVFLLRLFCLLAPHLL
jgi:hypothetical protein